MHETQPLENVVKMYLDNDTAIQKLNRMTLFYDEIIQKTNELLVYHINSLLYGSELRSYGKHNGYATDLRTARFEVSFLFDKDKGLKEFYLETRTKVPEEMILDLGDGAEAFVGKNGYLQVRATEYTESLDILLKMLDFDLEFN